VLARGTDPAKIAIVPNWADSDQVRPLPPDPEVAADLGTAGKFVVLYAGNLGLSQSLDQTLAAAEQLRHEPVLFAYVGDGASKAKLQAFAAERGLTNVVFRPYQPKERMAAYYSVADLHLVTLQRGLAGCIVPSKLYGVLAAGGAYVAAIDADSEVASITEQHQCGLRVEPDDAAALVAAVRWAMGHRDELRRMGANGRRLVETELNRASASAAFDRVVRAAAKEANL
jgi:glycosyltransferase involved in cell wall biosynthesis